MSSAVRMDVHLLDSTRTADIGTTFRWWDDAKAPADMIESAGSMERVQGQIHTDSGNEHRRETQLTWRAATAYHEHYPQGFGTLRGRGRRAGSFAQR